jgi:hypothetical protein
MFYVGPFNIYCRPGAGITDGYPGTLTKTPENHIPIPVLGTRSAGTRHSDEYPLACTGYPVPSLILNAERESETRNSNDVPSDTAEELLALFENLDLDSTT